MVTWRALWERLRCLLPRKLALVVGLAAVICVPYFGLQHISLFPVRIVPEIFVDRWISFQPKAACVYLSLFLFMALPALFSTRREELVRAMTCVIATMAISCMFFVIFPSGVVRPAVPSPLDPAYDVILATDLPVNVCPSLHAAFALLAALLLDRLLGRGHPLARLLTWAWAAAIFYAALATKQHVALDLLAGSALAVVVYSWVHVDVPAHAVSTEPTLSQASLQAEPSYAARRFISTGLGAELEVLRRFQPGKRWLEIVVFPALWGLGATLTLTWGREWWLAWCLGVFVSAVALNAFVLLLHEGMHEVLFRNSRANRFAAALFGMPLLISFTAYQVMHLRHHNYLGDPRDPDEYQNHVRNRRVLWFMHFLRLTFGAFAYLLFIPRLAWSFGTPRHRRQLVQEYAVMACFGAAALAFVPGYALLSGWFIPAVLVGLMTNVRGFTQHGITNPADPYVASRSIHAHPIVAFLLLHENYHLEHHLFPEVPSYHLAALHRLIWPRLPRAVMGQSYLAFLGKFLWAARKLDETPIGLVQRQAEDASGPEISLAPGRTRRASDAPM